MKTMKFLPTPIFNDFFNAKVNHKINTKGFLFSFLLLLLTNSVLAQLSRFAQLSTPIGIEVDGSGYVHVGHDNISSKLISKFSQYGQVRNRVSIGNFFSFGYDVRMARIPSSGQILGVFPNGDLVVMNPQNNRITMLGNLKRISISTSRMYDVNLGRYSNVAGNILPAASQTLYGDIAVYERGKKLYVFITAVTARFPFIVRLIFDNGNYQGAKVVTASSGADYTTPESPRGIAVNKYGKVMTSLPYKRTTSSPGYDAGVTFSYNFASKGRPSYLFNKAGLPINGMCTDKNGNFYVATSAVGSAISGGSSGAVVALNASLTKILWTARFGGAIVTTQDVAVNTNASRAYITVSNHNSVYQVDLTKLKSKSAAVVGESPIFELPAETVAEQDGKDKLPTSDKLSKAEIVEYDPAHDYALPQPAFPESWTDADATTPSIPEITTPMVPEVTPIELTVFPNPTTDWIQVKVQSNQPVDYELALFDANGRRVWNERFSVGDTPLNAQIDVRNFPSGTYFLQVVNEDMKQVKSIIKR